MITDKTLREQHGDDIIFLFKGNEPYVNMHGRPAGVLIEKDGKVICNECGRWFGNLAMHLRHHQMTSGEYKEKYGFNRSAPLCSTEMSEKRREQAMQVNSDADTLRERGKKGGRPKGIKTKYRMQNLNRTNSCPEQVKQRFLLLVAKFGEKVSLPIVRQYDSGLPHLVDKYFGSWNKLKATMNMKFTPYRKEKADLIYDLRAYVQKHLSLPWEVKTMRRKHNFPHSMKAYVNHWGSQRRALMACGVDRSGDTNRGKANRLSRYIVK